MSVTVRGEREAAGDVGVVRPAPRGRALAAMVVLPLVGGVLGFVLAMTSSPQYTSHAYLLVSNTGGSGETPATSVAQALARVATSESVLQAQGAPSSVIEAARDGRLTASSSPDAPLLDLAATAGSRASAVTLTNALVDGVENQVSLIGPRISVRSTLVAPASRPSGPSSPSVPVDVAAGVALGLLGSVLVLVLTRRRTEA